jgi:hypothetical protein
MNRSNMYPSKDPIVKFKQEMKLRGFSNKTVKSYLYYTQEYLHFTSVGASEVTAKIVRDYLEYLWWIVPNLTYYVLYVQTPKKMKDQCSTE